MATDTDVLLHHSVSAVFGNELSQTLQSQLKSSLPNDTNIERATTPTESKQKIHGAEIVLTMRPLSDDLTQTSTVEWIQTLNAGLDSFNLDTLSDMGIALTNASGVAANPIAEQVLGYMLVFERKIHTGIRQQEQKGIWKRYSGGELNGKTVGIIGVGAIGTRVAELTSGLNMNVIGTKRTPDTAPDLVDEIYPPEDLEKVLTQSDYIVIACPLVEETRGLIGLPEIMAMDSDAVLINVARGEIIDEKVLERSLQQGRIQGAALDVFEQEPLPQDSLLWELSNVIVTPHMAGSTPRYAERVKSLFIENYERYIADGSVKLKNQIV